MGKNDLTFFIDINKISVDDFIRLNGIAANEAMLLKQALFVSYEVPNYGTGFMIDDWVANNNIVLFYGLN